MVFLVFRVRILLLLGILPVLTYSIATESWAQSKVQPQSTSKFVYAMAPLLVVDPRQQHWRTHAHWSMFSEQLKSLKRMGVRGISIDVWWGIVQRQNLEIFDWSYYDQVFRVVGEAGLTILPILSMHGCGNIIGDNIVVPLPTPFIKLMPKLAASGLDSRFLSEGNNISEETIGIWDFSHFRYFQRFWKEFVTHFEPYAHSIDFLIAGVGAAGEVGIPSYHAHDWMRGYGPAQYPNRGSLQASSIVAQRNFQAWLKLRYSGNIHLLNQNWQRNWTSFEEIEFLRTAGEVDSFVPLGPFSSAGQDFFDWYHQSLMEYSRSLLVMASDIIQTAPGFKKKALAIKIPGIRWTKDNRFPELAAGLISTRGGSLDMKLPSGLRLPPDWTVENGLGYESLFVNLFEEFRKLRPQTPLLGIFTAGEFANNHPPGGIGYDLVEAMGILAKRHQISFLLENAHAESLLAGDGRLLGNILSHFHHEFITGVILLRMDSVLRSQFMNQFIEQIPPRSARNCAASLAQAN